MWCFCEGVLGLVFRLARGFVLGGVLGVIWTCHVALKQGSSRQQISMMSYLMASDFFSCAMPSCINFSLILGHVVFYCLVKAKTQIL